MKDQRYAKIKTIEERIDIWINRYQFLMERWQNY